MIDHDDRPDQWPWPQDSLLLVFLQAGDLFRYFYDERKKEKDKKKGDEMEVFQREKI